MLNVAAKVMLSRWKAAVGVDAWSGSQVVVGHCLAFSLRKASRRRVGELVAGVREAVVDAGCHTPVSEVVSRMSQSAWGDGSPASPRPRNPCFWNGAHRYAREESDTRRNPDQGTATEAAIGTRRLEPGRTFKRQITQGCSFQAKPRLPPPTSLAPAPPPCPWPLLTPHCPHTAFSIKAGSIREGPMVEACF